MADLSVFLDKNFDPKAYINAACENIPSDQSLDRFLSELEMRLHLGSEDINLYLEDQSIRASQRIPIAARELAQIREDAQAVRISVTSALTKLQENSSQTSVTSTLSQLQKLDAVKSRMEDACNTLKEAASLSTLFSLVDDLFASGDLVRSADALAGIRRGLLIVSDSVPEFKNGRQRLNRLEEKFSAAAQAPLSDAFTNQRGSEASSLARILLSMDREEQVSSTYIASRSAPLWSLWEGFTSGTPFISWVSTFYDQLLHSIVSECDWCSSTLPDLYPELVLKLMISFFNSIDQPYRARLAGALTGTQGSLLPLEHLEQAAAATSDFVNSLKTELSSLATSTVPDTDTNEVGSTVFEILQLIVAPLEGAIDQYHEKELVYLSAEVSRLLQNARDARDVPSLHAALRDTVGPVLGALDAAKMRCVRITGGTSFAQVVKVMDRVLQQYISAVQASISTKTKTSSPSSPSGAGAISNVQNTVATIKPELVLPFLLIVNKLKHGVEEFAANLTQTISATIPDLLLLNCSSGNNSSAANDILLSHLPPTTTLRFQSHPNLGQILESFLQEKTTRKMNNSVSTLPLILPSTFTALRDLEAVVDALCEGSLCAPAATQFSVLPNLKEWHAKPTTSVSIPNFTPYPLQYVTSAAEYLMLLPQILESTLLSNPEQEEGEQLSEVVAKWVDRAALAASDIYVKELRKIKKTLSEQGVGQLTADIEYFTNVLSTLGLGIPPALAAWQAALVAPDGAALEALLADLRGNDDGDAREAVQDVARLRGLILVER